MSAEDNKSLIRRWIDLWNAQNAAGVGDLVTPDYIRHDPNSPEVHGPEDEKRLATMYFTAFPDLHFTIEDLIAEGDEVAVRYTARGTHKGELLGIPPSNQQITVVAMEIYRLADDKIAEQWVVIDALGMLQQIGAIPGPGS